MRVQKLMDNLDHYCAYNGIVGENKAELVRIIEAITEKSIKPIRDTKFGKWLQEHAPELLDLVGDLLPDKGVWKVIKHLIDKLDLDSEKKEHGIKMFELETYKD
jgi:hypothetical protein